MSDDARPANRTSTHETLNFHFTPVDPPKPEEGAINPLAKRTTHVPDVVAALKERFGQDIIETTLYANEHTVRVARERIVDIGRFLKEELGFTYFVDLGGIDRFTEEDRFEIFYNLVNIDAGKRLRLKIRVDENEPVAPSVTGVWRAANWQERECWDMFGIRFEGHPDLRRMYMPEDFEYHPLRKEFPLLGIPGSLPLPPQAPDATVSLDPFPAAHGSKPIKSYEEPETDLSEE